MKDQRVYLKVKLKSLAAEARIIRQEEKKAKSTELKNGLSVHRRTVVRYEARYTHLAYGYLRGRSHAQIEKASSEPDWEKVKKMVDKYGLVYDGSGSYEDYRNQKQQQLADFETWKKEIAK